MTFCYVIIILVTVSVYLSTQPKNLNEVERLHVTESI